MRTRTERDEALAEIEKAVTDHDVMLVRALLEVCRRIEEASERAASAHDETREAIDRLGEALGQPLKQAAGVWAG